MIRVPSVDSRFELPSTPIPAWIEAEYSELLLPATKQLVLEGNPFGTALRVKLPASMHVSAAPLLGNGSSLEPLWA